MEGSSVTMNMLNVTEFVTVNLSLQNYVTLESSTTVSVRVYKAFDFRILT